MTLTHESIWRAIDALAAKHNLSLSGLARAASLDSTTLNKSRRFGRGGRPRWPSTESIAALLEATGEDMLTLVALIDGKGDG